MNMHRDTNLSRHPFLRHDAILAFAHRGGTTHAPGNTLAGFEHAIALGYRYLETDVHASRDGVLYAFHDDDVKWLVSRDCVFSDLSAADIDSIRIGGMHAIPTMSALLEAFPEARFNIDVKVASAIDPLCDVIIATSSASRVCIAAFEDARLRAVVRKLKRARQDVCHSVGMMNATRFRLGAYLRLPQWFSAGCLQLPLNYGKIRLITLETVAYAHRLGLQIHAWTIDDTATMEELLDIGVDGIMTNDCARLKAVLLARNLWDG